jgi:hypothetical protein
LPSGEIVIAARHSQTLQVVKGDDSMPALATDPAATPAAASDPMSITTTLYDLVGSLNAEVAPEDDALVIAAVIHLVHGHRARFVGSCKRLALVDAYNETTGGCGSGGCRELGVARL